MYLPERRTLAAFQSLHLQRWFRGRSYGSELLDHPRHDLTLLISHTTFPPFYAYVFVS